MNIDRLDKQTLKLVNRIVRGGVNYLSGTMAPAKSDPETNDIESLGKGFEHYAKRGVKEVVVQPKYMGSRCQAYIFRDFEKCYAVSRNGFKIKADITNALKERWEFWFGAGDDKNTDVEMVIEDAELMPWSILGEGLIEENFGRYSFLYNSELSTLEAMNWERARSETITKLKEKESLTKQEQSTLDNLKAVPHTGRQKEQLFLFDKQLSIFGKKGDAYLKPFNILKIVRKTGKEDIFMDLNKANYFFVSEDPFVVVDPSDWLDNEELRDFMAWVNSNKMEGVVIKPSTYRYHEDRELRYAPYLKVRNREYLRLVYGPDYTSEDKLKALVEKKMIGRKLGASIREYEIGRKLLDIPVSLLDNSNQHYKELVAEAVMQFKRDEELDPRL